MARTSSWCWGPVTLRDEAKTSLFFFFSFFGWALVSFSLSSVVVFVGLYDCVAFLFLSLGLGTSHRKDWSLGLSFLIFGFSFLLGSHGMVAMK
jgi:hypothetical protein